MNKQAFSKNKYSVYCREHLKEFRDGLRDEASQALTSWPGRAVALLLILSAGLNYLDANSRGNPLAGYTLLTYAFPILLIALFPLVSLIFSSIEKYSPQVLDLFCGSSLIGFCVTLGAFFEGADSREEVQTLTGQLLIQINFLLFLGTSFSYRQEYLTTLLRNIGFTGIMAFGTYRINPDFFSLIYLQLIQGFLAGSLASWLFFESMRMRFYSRSTDADTREHLYKQLSKLVYPHQLERIKLGDELENTMPLQEGKAIINVFDVQRSSEIRHEKTQDFFMGVFQSFLQICMKDYEHNPLRSRAFRLKETGDGFISAIGYPFLALEAGPLADTAVATALEMFETFNKEVEKFRYSRPIKGAIGLAYNSVQGTFQSGGIRSYDLFGDALVQASKYEELRKNPVIWSMATKQAVSLGLKDFHILFAQEVVYNSLSPAYRELFIEVDLAQESLSSSHVRLYDQDSNFIYFHVLD